MTEANKANAQAATHELFDFKNMPLTNEQKILATLERIEVLLTPKIGVQTTGLGATPQPVETVTVKGGVRRK